MAAMLKTDRTDIATLSKRMNNDSPEVIVYVWAFEDRYGLLRGTGKSSKHVKIKSLDTANKEALKYYVRLALELDAK